MKINLKPTGFIERFDIKGPKTLCFRRESYSTCKAECHLGQSSQDLASAKDCGSEFDEFGLELGRAVELKGGVCTK